MPRKRTGKRQKENLNLYGEWIETLTTILGIHWADVARRAGITEGTMSKGARSVDNRPWPATVTNTWKAIQEIAQERGISFSPSVEQGFINAANYVTEIQKDVSGTILRMVRNQYAMSDLDLRQGDITNAILEAYRQETVNLRLELSRKEERIAELEAELQKWRS